ncbi:MAG: thiamine phosphate synthase [Tannerella sp.]|jgi:thiamine-phosphate pyrophosphorylase|nr:thiamine phosphate synthase [Tannerella sp.]
MKLIVITTEGFFDREPEAIHKLFENGMEILHVRKPHASSAETKRFIEQIDIAFHSRIVVHDYYELTSLFGLKGIHLNRRNYPWSRKFYSRHNLCKFSFCGEYHPGNANIYSECNPENPDTGGERRLSISGSCHSFDEITDAQAKFDYMFLSPIFDSISKAGYKQGYTPEQLNDAKAVGIINDRVIALGGMNVERISEVRRYGFGGVAVLGSLWTESVAGGDIDGLLERFHELRKRCEED